MEITKTIQPGEPGTHQLLRKFGNRMVCVRYRKDQQLQKRYTTVELIVAERPYNRIPVPKIKVWVYLEFNETDLRKKIKAAGGKWLAKVQRWEMEESIAKKMGLKKRITKRLVDLDV